MNRKRFNRSISTGLVAVVTFSAVLLSRDTQAATVLDVTGSTTYTQGAYIGGNFTVQKAYVQPSGTGVFNAFLGMQQPANVKDDDPTYEYPDAQLGFNTDNTNPDPPLDDLGGTHTHALKLSAIPIFDLNPDPQITQLFYEFVLDAAQKTVDKLDGVISLNQVQLFQSPGDLGKSPYSYSITGPNVGVDAVISFSGGPSSLVFQMNDSTRTSSSYEVKVGSGSGNGSADMFLYVSYELFNHEKNPDGTFKNPYVTLFSQFGSPPGLDEANSSFEEWGTRSGVGILPDPDNHGTGDPVPEPGSLIVWGMLGLAGTLYRRRSVA